MKGDGSWWLAIEHERDPKFTVVGREVARSSSAARYKR
jgi:hypothetical protein